MEKSWPARQFESRDIGNQSFFSKNEDCIILLMILKTHRETKNCICFLFLVFMSDLDLSIPHFINSSFNGFIVIYFVQMEFWWKK
jgi:hypothetical protein